MSLKAFFNEKCRRNKMIKSTIVITDKREINSTEFHDIVYKFISEIADDSNDKELLDRQTTDQI
ncbi:hypothetical protein LCGC14_0828290, partial [marine sediment metagenome]